MGKKKKKQSHNHDEEKIPSFSLPSEVTRAIVLVVAITTALIFALSLLGYAGTFGTYIDYGVRIIFGWGAWFFPLMLVLITFFWVKSAQRIYKIIKVSAAIIFVLVYSALFSLRIPPGNLLKSINSGEGGGYVGLVFSYPLLKLTTFLVALIILSALGTVCLLLMFENRLFKVGRGVAWILKKLGLTDVFTGLGSKVAEKVKHEPEYIATLGDGIVHETEDRGAVDETVSEDGEKDEAADVKKDVPVPENEAITKSLHSKYRRKIDMPLNLLEKRSETPSSGDIEANKEKIKQALMNFGIEVEMAGTSTGPTVTQYTLKPNEGVKLAQITALHNDLALALAAHPIRIEAPIPGKSLVGIEVPNAVIATVGVREILQSDKFHKERKSNLTLALGKDVSGSPYTYDLGRMPHLLIAGATGSGKSVSINVIILSLLYQNSPDDLKLILVDPKRVELSSYNEIPHLLTPVITDAKKTINALKWTVSEMNRRYDTLAEAGARNLEMYNRTSEERMPYIIIIIDELADLMSIASKEVEALIVRLAQMARAVGIHLILATQRPSVNVITGLIKANITCRIAFAVASQTDSRTILDTGGAEKLLGRGDMLFMTADLSKPKRLQGAYVDDHEIKSVARFLKNQAEPDYLEEVVEKKVAFSMPGANSSSPSFDDFDGDALLDEARELVVRSRKASASYFQRHLRVGYARAARLLDLLEAEGIVGPGDGAKPRDVLAPSEEGNIEESENE